jgi:hypothetical protein
MFTTGDWGLGAFGPLWFVGHDAERDELIANVRPLVEEDALKASSGERPPVLAA